MDFAGRASPDKFPLVGVVTPLEPYGGRYDRYDVGDEDQVAKNEHLESSSDEPSGWHP